VQCETDGKLTINPTIVTLSMMVVKRGLLTMAKDITDPKQLNNNEPSGNMLHDYHDID
jgi:ribose/xylose/arabinose/galactoside ABC-type transport system permease subunit